MTEETPQQRKQPKGIACDDCNRGVYVATKQNGSLTLTCDCDKQRSIRVAAVLPEGWS